MPEDVSCISVVPGSPGSDGLLWKCATRLCTQLCAVACVLTATPAVRADECRTLRTPRHRSNDPSRRCRHLPVRQAVAPRLQVSLRRHLQPQHPRKASAHSAAPALPTRHSVAFPHVCDCAPCALLIDLIWAAMDCLDGRAHGRGPGVSRGGQGIAPRDPCSSFFQLEQSTGQQPLHARPF